MREMKAIVIPTNTNAQFEKMYWNSFEIALLSDKDAFLNIPKHLRFAGCDKLSFTFDEIAIVDANVLLHQMNDYILGDEYPKLNEDQKSLIESKVKNLDVYCKYKGLVPLY